MSKKAKFWTIFSSVMIIVVITILSLCLCLIPIKYDSVTLKQLDTRVGKGCIVPKDTGNFEFEEAKIQFVYYREYFSSMEPQTDRDSFEYCVLKNTVGTLYPIPEKGIDNILEYKETFVYKNKKPHKEKDRLITGIGSYNRVGYNPQSIGYTMKLHKLNESNQEKVSVDIGVHKPSETIRVYGGNVDFYTFGTKVDYKGIELYYAYEKGELAMCFAKDQVVYCFCIRIFQQPISSEVIRVEAEEVLSLYIK